MKVTVKFTPYISILTKTDRTDIDLNENARMSDLLKVLTKLYGERFIDLLHTSELNYTDVWASVIVDGRTVLVDGLDRSDIKLKEGSVIVILGPVGGG